MTKSCMIVWKNKQTWLFILLTKFHSRRLYLLPLNWFMTTNFCDQIAITTIKQRLLHGKNYSRRWRKKSRKFLHANKSSCTVNEFLKILIYTFLYHRLIFKNFWLLYVLGCMCNVLFVENICVKHYLYACINFVYICNYDNIYSPSFLSW